MEAEREKMVLITSLQQTLRETRQELMNCPPNPGIGYIGTPEEYQQGLIGLEERMEQTAQALSNARAQGDVVLECNEALAQEIGMTDKTIVLHYKKNMDDQMFLPSYPEGVVWLTGVPQGVPELCEHLESWKSRPAPNVKSPFEEFHDNIRAMLNVDGTFSEVEKADWVACIHEQAKCAFPKASLIEDADGIANTEEPQVRLSVFTFLTDLITSLDVLPMCACRIPKKYLYIVGILMLKTDDERNGLGRSSVLQ